MSLTGWRAQQQLDVQWPESRFNEELWVQGRITSLPERSVDRYADAHDGTRTWRFSFVPQGADAKAVPQKIRVSWYRSDVALEGGQCWRFLLRLRAPHGSLDPGGFDYERSEEHTSELQSLMRISYAVFCLKKKKIHI